MRERIEKLDRFEPTLLQTPNGQIPGLEPDDHGEVVRYADVLSASPIDRGRDTPDVTRVEVIDHRTQRGDGEPGRVFVALGCRVELSYQDGGRTLKVFVDDADTLREPSPSPSEESPR